MNTSTKQLFKILIGAAKIDREIQEEERRILYKLLDQENLLDDPEIKDILSEVKPVTFSDCDRWFKEYIGENPKTEDYRMLLESVIGLVHLDGEVKEEEAELIKSLKQLDPKLNKSSISSTFEDNFFKIIRDFIHRNS